MAVCIANITCSGHGTCRADNTCRCSGKWRLSDCSQPLSALTSTPLYKADQWLFVVWYCLMTIVIGACLYRIRRDKNLVYGFLVGDHLGRPTSRVDLQQLTMGCFFIHCVLGFVEYSLNPCGLKPAPPPLIAFRFAILHLGALALMAGAYFMVRMWVAMKTLGSNHTQIVLRVFDVVCITAFFAAAITAYRLDVWFSIFAAIFFTTVVLFAIWYGVKLIVHLRQNSDEKSNSALRKLTGLVLSMAAANILGMIGYLVNLILSNKLGHSLVLEADIMGHLAYAVAITAVVVALGRPTDLKRKQSQHGSRKRGPDIQLNSVSRYNNNSNTRARPPTDSKSNQDLIIDPIDEKKRSRPTVASITNLRTSEELVSKTSQDKQSSNSQENAYRAISILTPTRTSQEPMSASLAGGDNLANGESDQIKLAPKVELADGDQLKLPPKVELADDQLKFPPNVESAAVVVDISRAGGEGNNNAD